MGKINLSNFLHELSDGIFQINRGLFFTLRELFVRPGPSIRDYLEGKRKNHFKPVAYLFTLSTIYFILSRFFESSTLANDFIVGFSNVNEGSKGLIASIDRLQWFAENLSFAMLALVPLTALASYLAFLGSGYNYLEHFVLNAYITGQQIIFYGIASLLSVVIDSNDLLDTFLILLSIAYNFYVFWQFFSKLNRVGVVFRSILYYFLFMIFLTISTALIVYT